MVFDISKFVLSGSLEISDKLDSSLLAIEFRISHGSGAELDQVLLLSVKVFHLSLILLSLVIDLLIILLPFVFEPTQDPQFLVIFELIQNLVKHPICAINSGFNQFMINFLFFLFLCSCFSLSIVVSLSIFQLSCFSHLVINKLIIKIFEAIEHLNCIQLVVSFVL